LTEHHNLSLKILVGRSLPQLPWSLDEDQELISQERVLWAALTDEERAQEQETLVVLWGSRKAVRIVHADPSWGMWAEGLGEVKIPDTAFGIPSNDLRPYSKGKPLEKDSTALWLYERGYQVVDFTDEVYTILVSHLRANPEAERLMSLLARKNPGLIHPWGSYRGGIQLRATFDPVTGRSQIELKFPSK
jgi:hypothetical protein